MSRLALRVAEAVAGAAEADDALRRIVDLVAEEPAVRWAGLAFVEDGTLVLGPAAGTPDEGSRRRMPVRYQGDLVAELWVDGHVDGAVFESIPPLIGQLCLVGWDTGGKPWGSAT